MSSKDSYTLTLFEVSKSAVAGFSTGYLKLKQPQNKLLVTNTSNMSGVVSPGPRNCVLFALDIGQSVPERPNEAIRTLREGSTRGIAS